MLQLVLLIWGVFVAVRLPGVRRRTAADYPGVDPELFAAWHRADLQYHYVFLAATWGAALLQTAILVAGGLLHRALPVHATTIAFTSLGLALLAFVAPLIWAAMLGRRVAARKREAGIA